MIALIHEGPNRLLLRPLNGKPLLQWQLESLARSGVYNALIVTRDETAKKQFGGSCCGVKLRYGVETKDLGSGGAFFLAAKFIKEDFLFVDGDILFDIDAERLRKYHRAKQAIITALVHPSLKPSEDDILIENASGKALHVMSKEEQKEIFFANVAPSGIYIVSKLLLDTFRGPVREVSIDFQKELFAPTVYADGVYLCHSSEYVRRVSEENLASLSEDLSRGVVASRNLSKPQKAVFLDRDGVLNVFGDYVVRPELLTLKPDAVEALKRLNSSKYLALLCTNQPIVARGEATLGAVKEVHNKLEDLLAEGGSYLDGIYCCPHFPSRGDPNENPEFSIDCDCRKPKIGMLLQAKKDFNVDLKASWFVGDTHQDVQTGINAGCRTIMVTSGDPNPAKKNADAKPDYVVKDLAEAVELILSSED